MRFLYIVILLLVSLTNVYAQSADKSRQNLLLKNLQGKELSVSLRGPAAFIFLSPECPLSKNYTVVINKLQKKYAQIKFYGVFSGKHDVKQLKSFQQDYQIKFELVNDPLKLLVRQYGASVTPQVFLINQSGEVIYNGLIDNWPVSLGKQRQVTTRFYLEDAIESYLTKRPVAISHTEPIGCLIDDDIN